MRNIVKQLFKDRYECRNLHVYVKQHTSLPHAMPACGNSQSMIFFRCNPRNGVKVIFLPKFSKAVSPIPYIKLTRIGLKLSEKLHTIFSRQVMFSV